MRNLVLLFLVACGVPTNIPNSEIPEQILTDATIPDQPDSSVPPPNCRAGTVPEDQYKAYPAVCYALSYARGHFNCIYYIADQATKCKSEFDEFTVFMLEDEPNVWEAFNDSGYLGTIYKESNYNILTYTIEINSEIKECTISGEIILVCNKENNNGPFN